MNMNMYSIIISIIILHHIVAVIRYSVLKYVFKRKEEKFINYYASRVTFFMGGIVFGVLDTIFSSIYSVEFVNYLFRFVNKIFSM